MGNTKKTETSNINYVEFDKRLLSETSLLGEWFIEQRFMERELEIGAEIELFLLEENGDPATNNLQFIDLVNKPYLIPEVGVAHLEINSAHVSLTGNCLSTLHKSILQYWQYCCQMARAHHQHLALIGSLPTATEKHHELKYITNKERYYLIDGCMAEQRAGKPIGIDVDGYERLTLQPESLAMNGLISAFQMHLQIGFSQSVRCYNVAQAIAGPVLAISCNSPYIFGRHVWSDSRIVTFDQVMTLPRFDRARGFKCCLFGTSYLRDSFFELFDQNYQYFPRLIPEVDLTMPIESMFHVRRQNGVVYRWNRPVIDFNKANQAHLRIEHRGPSAGPTVVDMVANAAFYYGLLNYFAIQPTPIEYLLPFHLARENFFKAARFGLNAPMKWFAGHEISACDLVKNLIPLARNGLQALGVDRADIEYYLGLIEQRVMVKRNGSDWQCQFIEKYGKDFHHMMAVYLENQYQEIPVAEWKI